MKKRRFFTTLLFMLSLTTGVSALECNINYDTVTNELHLTGTAQAPVSVLVIPSNADTSQITNENPPIAGVQFNYHSETEFDEIIRLDANLLSGLYTVMVQSNEENMSMNVSDGNQTSETTSKNFLTINEINHISANDATELLAAINAELDDAEALYTLMITGTTNGTANTWLLQIEPAAFENHGSYICKQMVGTKNGKSFSNIKEVIELIEEYKALYDVTRATSYTDAITLLETNAEIFSADIRRFVSSLNDATAKKLVALINSFEANGESFSEALPKLSALATAQAADRWKTFHTMITDTYADVLNIDYINLDIPDEVYYKMMDYDYNTFDDIADNFEKAISAINDTESHHSNSTGGGGSVSFGPSLNLPKESYKSDVNTTFSDVATDFWGYNAISTLVEKGVVSGYPDGTYLPNRSVTRAEFVKMLVSAFGITTEYNNTVFEDVNPSDWCYNYISSAYSNGLINGISEQIFDPNGAITREDACVIVYRYLSKLDMLNSNKIKFDDEAKFADYATDAIASLAGNGIVSGIGNNCFDPKAYINRASCAVLILNCLNSIG